jgi:DNA-binding MarR family transcriptional regulator
MPPAGPGRPTPDEKAPFSPLADPTRRAIFERLLAGPTAVKVIAAELPISQPAVSHHLKILKQAGLVTEQRQGRYRLYEANPAMLERLSLQFGDLRNRLLADGEEKEARLRSGEFDAIDSAMERWTELWPDHHALAVGVMVRLRLIARHLETLSERAAARFQLDNVQVALLATLDRLKEPRESTLTELSRLSFMSLPAMSRYIDRSEKKGLISRRQDANDARSNLISITDKGRELLHEVMRSQREEEHAAVYQMSEEELLRLARLLRPLLHRLQDSLE